MRIGGQTVITDPVFGNSVSPIPITMKRFQPAPAEIDELLPVDIILISHSHYDRSSFKSLARLCMELLTVSAPTRVTLPSRPL